MTILAILKHEDGRGETVELPCNFPKGRQVLKTSVGAVLDYLGWSNPIPWWIEHVEVIDE